MSEENKPGSLIPPAGFASAVEYSLPVIGGATVVSWIADSVPAVDAPTQAHQEAEIGRSLYLQRRFSDAVARYREAVRMQPQRPDYHWQLAMSAWEAGQLDLVEPHFREAVRLEPRNAMAHSAIGQWYFEAEKYDRALVHTARATQRAPDDADIAVLRAVVLERTGDPEAAWKLIEPLLAEGMCNLRIGLLFSRLAPSVKREREAMAMLDRLALAPGVTEFEKAHLNFAMGTLLDRLGQHDEAFQRIRSAKEATRQPYDPLQLSGVIDREISYFSAEKLRRLPRATHGNRRPVFIIGMPRSGTSLVEQILASHPDVFGAGELQTLNQLVNTLPQSPWTQGRMYPESLDLASARDLDELAQVYLSNISALNSASRYITDKYPLNFLNLGLIALLFPDCHVIHCRRDPMDTCLSCYLTLFLPPGLDYTQTLSYLGAYYRDYRRDMQHWRKVRTFPMLEVDYEDVVNDLEGQTRRLLEFLDLPWDERCLKFHQTRRQVTTPSRDQVRRPIYNSSIGRWKQYERHLSELLTALDAPTLAPTF